MSEKELIYKKTQIGWLIIGVLFVLLSGLIFAYKYQWGTNPISTVPFIIIISILLLGSLIFCQLIVSINYSTINLTYGIGLVRFNISIDELHEAQAVSIPWHYGLGIRITPKGMLYNLQGSQAVLISYCDSGIRKTVMIGSPEPDKLVRTIEKIFNSEPS